MDEIEALKQLKARYFRLLDTKDWTAFRALLTDDFESDTSDAGGRVVHGADEFTAFVRKSLADRVTVHQGHTPEIDILTPTTATGIWALNDIVRLVAGVDMYGYGHYHETYVKVDDQWRISTSKLTRLRVDIVTGLVSVHISARLDRFISRLTKRPAG